MTSSIARFIRLVLIPAAVIALAAGSTAQTPAPGHHRITVTVMGIRNTAGNIRLALRSDPNTTVQGKVAEIDAKTLTATVVFDDVAPGTYGIGVIHDENKNSKLDFDEMGMPLEGYGHSNNPAKRPGPPAWDEYKFVLDKDATISIDLIYWQ